MWLSQLSLNTTFALFLLAPSGSEVTVHHERASSTSPPLPHLLRETEVTGTVLHSPQHGLNPYVPVKYLDDPLPFKILMIMKMLWMSVTLSHPIRGVTTSNLLHIYFNDSIFNLGQFSYMCSLDWISFFNHKLNAVSSCQRNKQLSCISVQRNTVNKVKTVPKPSVSNW